MRLQAGIYSYSDDMLLLDISRGLAGFTRGIRGDELLSAFISLTEAEAAYWRNNLQAAHRVKVYHGSSLIWDGRLEAVAISLGGIRVEAAGHWMALTDLPYTSLWSYTGYAEWEPVTSDDDSNYNPELYALDTNNRLYISPITNQTYDSTERAGLVYKGPHNGQQDIKLISFTWELAASMAGWRLRIYGYDEGYASETTLFTQDGAIGAQSGAELVTLSTAQPIVVVALYRTSSVTYSSDIGAIYAKLTNLRVASSNANQINTTLGTTIAAGSRTVTPGSMANIFVGQGLIIGGSTTERVVVTAITATTFTAVFANGHSSTDAVEAIFIPRDEIAEAMATYINATNSQQILTDDTWVDAPGDDITDAVYHDRLPADILAELAEGAGYAARVKDRQLWYRAQGAGAATHYADLALEIEHNLADIYPSAYAVYQDERGRLLRTGATDDDDIIARLGLTRQTALQINTTSDTLAEAYRDAQAPLLAEPAPRAVISLRAIYNEQQARLPLWLLQPGDTIIARNLQPHLSWDITSFTVSRVEYNAQLDAVMIEPIASAPTLATMTARALGQLGQGSKERERIRVL